MKAILRYPVLLSGLGLLLGTINQLSIQNPILGFIAFFAYIGGLIPTITRRFPYYTAAQGGILALCHLMVLGSIYYYLLPISWIGLFALTFLPLPLLFLKEKAFYEIAITWPSFSPNHILLSLLSISTLFTLATYRFSEAVRSPWDIVPSSTLLLPVAVLAILLLVRAIKDTLTPTAMILPTVTCISLAGLVYAFRYGFDPFIHRATLEHILLHGTITPKPLYYTGQYVLELLGVKLFGIPLSFMDTWLVPLAAAMLLPYSVWLASEHKSETIILALLVPLSPFIFTTPQSLSYVFFALSIGGSVWLLKEKSFSAFYFASALAITTLFIHPISGIPACLFVALSACLAYAKTWSKIAAGMLSVISATAIPFLFWIQGSGTNTSTQIAKQHYNFSQLLPDLSNHFAGWLDALYAYTHLLLPLLILCGAIGVLQLVREKRYSLLAFSALSTSALIVNYFVLTLFFQFSFLVASERMNYADRLPYLVCLCALPLLAHGFSATIRYIKQSPARVPGFIFAMSLLIVGNVYAAYPRNDGEVRSAGFNVSTLDYQTAHSIHELIPTDDYVVLANQSLSAAALESYGFTHYFKNDIFYYPIPTGGPLYDIFLEMSNVNTTRATAQKAAQLTGANTVVFVSHAYWSGSEQARESAKSDADQWYTLGEHQEVMIFIYSF